MKKSKYIICPLCKEKARINIDNYKIGLYGCKKGHDKNIVLINNFEQTQTIDEAQIKCQNCNKVNKNTSYQNIFFICFECKKNLCQLCKSKHDNTHNIIDYDDKFFTCDIHYESYTSYCVNCKRDICQSCEMEHNEHKVISYWTILPNIKKVKEEKNNLYNEKEKFKDDIKDIINKLNNLIHSVDKYFKIYEDIINSYGNRKRNYYLLQNIHEIGLFNSICIQDINKIINETNLCNKINNIIDIYNKAYNMSEVHIQNNNNTNANINNETNNLNIQEEKKQNINKNIMQGIKPILGKMMNLVRDNILQNYRNNENILRNGIEPNEVEEVKNNYFDNLIILDNSLVNLITKEEGLNNNFDINLDIIQNKDEEKKYFELLINDYYMLYLNKYLNKNENEKREKNISNDTLDNNKSGCGVHQRLGQFNNNSNNN